MRGTIEKDLVKQYLDHSIRGWRRQRDSETDTQGKLRVCHYIDAFQSVRVFLFDEPLEGEEPR